MNIFKFPFSNLFLKNTHNRFLHSSGRDERKFYFCRMFLDFQKHFTMDLHFDRDITKVILRRRNYSFSTVLFWCFTILSQFFSIICKIQRAQI